MSQTFQVLPRKGISTQPLRQSKIKYIKYTKSVTKTPFGKWCLAGRSVAEWPRYTLLKWISSVAGTDGNTSNSRQLDRNHSASQPTNFLLCLV